jgi:site-specific recombinase XerD
MHKVPQLYNVKNNNKPSNSMLWLRISAFLSLKSVNTQRTYSSIVSEWCEFLGDNAGTEKSAELMLAASDLNAIAYRAWLEKKIGQKPRASNTFVDSKELTNRKVKHTRKDGYQSTLANATIRKKLTALRRIYRMLIAADLGISKNPFDSDSIPTPSSTSGQKRPTEMLDFNMVMRVVEAPTLDSPKGLRDRAILSVLFGGGLRRSEVVSLRLGDVKQTRKGTLFLRLRATKAKKDADQALPAWAADYVKKLLGVRKQEGALDGDFLFVSYRGKGGLIPTNQAFSDSGLYKLFRHYCNKVNAGKFLTPHSARATAITKLLEDGIGHREVQEFSRHASVQMVEVYDKRRISVDENAAKVLEYSKTNK